MEVVPFEIEHLALIDIREEQSQDIKPWRLAPKSELRKFIDSLVIKCSVFKNGKLLAIITVTVVNPYTAEICMLVSKHLADEYDHNIHRSLLEVLDRVKMYEFKRIQCSVRSDFKVGQRFIRAFGLKKEAVLKKLYGDTDGIIYSWVKGEE